MNSFLLFLHESYSSVQYLLKCSVFGSVPIEVASMGFLVYLLKRNRGIRLGCMINKSFCGVSFLAKKDDLKNGVVEIW